MKEFMGKRITLFCANYIYTGILLEIVDACYHLRDAAIVFETGPFDKAEWKDVQKLPGDWYVRLDTVESFGLLK